MLETLKGKWALVTGASSGIGREFCLQLAAAGVNIIAVARRKELLDALAIEITAQHGVECHALPMDLGLQESGSRIRQRLQERGVEISLLVNNAGVGQWGRFEVESMDAYEMASRVNDLAMVSLCHRFYPDLEANAPSAVVNVSSQAALQPVPFMAVYAATKAFVHSFSLALYEEWREKGIQVQTLIPGPTRTEFDQKAGAYESGIKERDVPEKAVSKSLRSLGSGQPVVASVKGVFTQRMFAGLFPPRRVVREVAKMFRPPEGGG